jgi:hypothetical protein
MLTSAPCLIRNLPIWDFVNREMQEHSNVTTYVYVRFRGCVVSTTFASVSRSSGEIFALTHKGVRPLSFFALTFASAPTRYRTISSRPALARIPMCSVFICRMPFLCLYLPAMCRGVHPLPSGSSTLAFLSIRKLAISKEPDDAAQ